MMRHGSRPMGYFCDRRTTERFIAVARDCRNMEVHYHDAQSRDFDPAVNYAPDWHGGSFPFASKTRLRRECSRKLAANALPYHNPRTAWVPSVAAVSARYRPVLAKVTSTTKDHSGSRNTPAVTVNASPKRGIHDRSSDHRP